MSLRWKRRASHAEYAEQARLRAQLYRVQARAMLDPLDAELAGFLRENYRRSCSPKHSRSPKRPSRN